MKRKITKIDINFEILNVNSNTTFLKFVDSSDYLSMVLLDNNGNIPDHISEPLIKNYEIIEYEIPRKPISYIAVYKEDWEKALPIIKHWEIEKKNLKHSHESLKISLDILNSKWYVKLGSKIEDVYRKIVYYYKYYKYYLTNQYLK